MEISSINNNYALNSPYDISADTIVIDNTPNIEDITPSNVNATEATATAVAIQAIPPESIELQELQDDISNSFNDLKEGNISKEDFTNTLKDLGIDTSKFLNESNEKQSITELSSALVETVKGKAQDGSEVDLSSYASVMDIINREIQSANVSEQLQAYTQNLRN